MLSHFFASLWWSALCLFPIGGAPLYYIYSLIFGRRHSTRASEAGGSAFISSFIKEYAYVWVEVPTYVALRLRLKPTAITFMGFAIVCAGLTGMAFGNFAMGGFVLLIGSVGDMLDGIIARKLNLCSDAGELIDSLVDRCADALSFLALTIYYRDNLTALGIIFVALVGSVLVSYVRAKAEALGVKNIPQGSMQRAERTVYLGFAVTLSPVLSYFIEPGVTHPLYAPTLVVCGVIGLFACLSTWQITRYAMASLNSAQAAQKSVSRLVSQREQAV